MLTVQPIRAAEARPFVVERHYARRMVGAMHRFGLFEDGELVGVVLYGQPAGANVTASVCGPDHADKVLVLSRLVVETKTQNAGSLFISRSLQLLPRPSVVITYADPNEGHYGGIYAACSWLYCGLSCAMHEYRLDSGETAQHRHVDKGRVVATTLQERKHRYLVFVGSRSQKRRLRKALLWPVFPPPKGTPSSTHGQRSRKVRRIEYRACDHCGGYFPPHRSDAKYCSPSCRTLAYYDRHRC
jgi:hypothetical protein